MKREFSKDRPPPLKITRPSDPHHHQQHRLLQQQQQQQQQHQHPLAHPHAPFRPPNPNHRQPVIIHTYSPEVIQTDSNNFRHLVQSLTGPAGHSSAPQPPPPKRARVSVPPGNLNPNYGSAQGSDSLRPPQIAPQYPGPRPLRSQHDAAYPYLESSIYSEGNRPCPESSSSGNPLPHNPLLSPSMFNFSPSVLPSPSTFSFDFPSMASPMGLRSSLLSPGSGPSSLASRRGLATPRSLAAALPSPGPLTSFLADLPALSPAAHSWVERNPASADAILLSARAAGEAVFTPSRAMMSSGLPPRPPPTTTANLFPVEDEKPILYREKQ